MAHTIWSINIFFIFLGNISFFKSIENKVITTIESNVIISVITETSEKRKKLIIITKIELKYS